jgi:hypothetical protein
MPKTDKDLVPISVAPATVGGFILPSIIAKAEDRARRRFLEFFTANIRNLNTRTAYAQAVGQFLAWCEERGLSLERIEPMVVAAYIEQHPGSAPTVKQHLAAIRMLFDWLVIGQVMPFNPATSVRGPRHVVKRGKTPVLSAAEARTLLDSIDTSHVVGLRDRAVISVMVFSFARVPGGIWLALYALTVLGMVGMGYQTGIAGSKRSHARPVLALAFALVFALIASLDRPDSGLIKVSQQPLIDARNAMAQGTGQNLEQTKLPDRSHNRRSMS